MEEVNKTFAVEMAGDGENYSDFLDEVKAHIDPIKELNEGEVHVRAMLVASDSVNSQGGRFDPEVLEMLCKLIPGAPVLIGHDKSKLPVARCFRAAVVHREDDDRPWVKVWFYWLSETAGADDLLRKIDGGICTECSLGFTFATPECSICGGDIRRCSHIPGGNYSDDAGTPAICHYYYRGVRRVNEISLVYRGAIPNTAMSRDLVDTDRHAENAAPGLYRLSNDAAALVLETAARDNPRLIVFPQFSERKLEEGMSLIGRTAEPGDFEEFLHVDRRSEFECAEFNCGKGKLLVSLSGERIECRLRRAKLHGDTAYLLTRAA